jgi:hypothetical protein
MENKDDHIFPKAAAWGLPGSIVTWVPAFIIKEAVFSRCSSMYCMSGPRLLYICGFGAPLWTALLAGLIALKFEIADWNGQIALGLVVGAAFNLTSYGGWLPFQ